VHADDGFIGGLLPDLIPSDPEIMWLALALNQTLYEIQDAEIQVMYTPGDTTLDLTMDGTLPLHLLIQQLLDPMPVPTAWQAGGSPPELNATNLPLIWLAMELVKVTTSAVDTASLHLGYNHETRTAEMNMSSSTRVNDLFTYLNNLLSKLTLEYEEQLELPPEMAQLVEDLFSIRFANITALQASSNYANGEAQFLMMSTFEGDVNAEVNYLKNIMISQLVANATDSLSWQMLYLNETELDVTGMNAWMTMDAASVDLTFTTLRGKLPVDRLNTTAFTLDRFFNLTAEESFPAQGEQLNITIHGGRNATHKVTLHNPTGIPDTDRMEVNLEGQPTSMTWNNVSLHELRPLQFILHERVLVAVTLTTPTTTDVMDTAVTLSWTENEDPDFVRYEIFQSPSAEDLGNSIANITNRATTTYAVHDLAFGTTYYFTVRVVDSFTITADSNQVTATTTVPIWAQPVFIAALLGTIGIAAVTIIVIRRRGSGLPR
jgi:hypothetical protein